VLSKICYEVMFLLGLFSESSLPDFYASTFSVSRSTIQPFRTRVLIKDQFKRRVRMLYPSWWRSNVDYSKIQYSPSHSIGVRVNAQGVAYITVSFFEVLRYQVLIEKLEPATVRDSEFLDKRLVFPRYPTALLWVCTEGADAPAVHAGLPATTPQNRNQFASIPIPAPIGRAL
jgi:hypothetical protein